MNRSSVVLAVCSVWALAACTPTSTPEAAAVVHAAPDSVPAASSAPVDAGPITRWSVLMPEDRSFQRPPPQIGVVRGNGMQGVGGLIDDSGAGTLPTQPIDHSSPQRAKQFGSSEVVEGVDGRTVDLDGFIVPLGTDDAGQVNEALFVPFYGACIHVPPPPPNQIIHVALRAPLAMGDLSDPYRLHGTLRVKRFDADIASASYDAADATLTPVSG